MKIEPVVNAAARWGVFVWRNESEMGKILRDGVRVIEVGNGRCVSRSPRQAESSNEANDPKPKPLPPRARRSEPNRQEIKPLLDARQPAGHHGIHVVLDSQPHSVRQVAIGASVAILSANGCACVELSYQLTRSTASPTPRR